MSDHARLSPSKRNRWSRCPGSVREEAKYPDVSGPGAIDGTHTHTLLELCLKQGNFDAYSMVGTWLEDQGGNFLVCKERASRVQVALDYVKSRLDLLNPAVLAAERKVNPVAAVGRDDMKGTADVQIGSLKPGIFEIADLKDGVNTVDPDSEQLRLYAVAALSELDKKNFDQIHTVRLTIIQPKAVTKGLQAVRFIDLKKDEFYDAEVAKLKAEAAATDDPDAPLIPGDVQCKYCKHNGACAARMNQHMTEAGLSFSDLEKVGEPTELTDEQIADVVAKAPVLRKMLESIEAEAQRRLESGKAINGLKLVRGRGTRSWLFEEEEMLEKLKRFGLNKSDIYEVTMISPAKAEKIITHKCKEKGTDPVKKLKTLSDEYIKTADGKITVATSDDPRPAVSLDASPMFGEVLPNWLS